MYSKLQLAKKYLTYYFTAYNGKGHGMHSPFIFDFIIHVLNDKKKYPEWQQVESLRKQLLTDPTIIEVEDFGAGSSIDKTNRRSIASIARNAAKPAKYGQLLHRMVRYYQPATIVELGTSLGITTSYLSLAKPDAKLITMEGASAIAETARQNFKTLKLQNVFLKEGNFDQTLPTVISGLSPVSFVFIDGNHRQEPTERYFLQFLPALHNDSIVVFDDIHWSKEMENAWQTIRENPAVRCSIDLFFIGIVFFRKDIKIKQHFMIRF